ncbi:MAG: septum site-determining protein MinD [Clostridiales bacterium]|jgi:septum site-determining protein MinD|nr:septum site-determining protein MinD [Clostridiales bacterium]
MARVVVVTSGKGGVGKTTLVANLGAALARAGERVVMMDTDIGLNNLDVVLGAENKVVYDIVDVVENKCRPRQALIDTEVPGLALMPAAHPYDAGKITGQNLKYVVNVLSESFTFVLLDCPAGIEAGFHRAVQAAGEALVVVTPHISSLRDAGKVLGILQSYETGAAGLVVNRARGDLMVNKEMLSVADIRDLLDRDVLGVIPDADEVVTAASAGHLVAANTPAAHAYDLLAKNLREKTNKIYDCTAKYRGLAGAFRRSLRKRV